MHEQFKIYKDFNDVFCLFLINCCCRPNGFSLTPLIEERIANFSIPLAVFDVCPFFKFVLLFYLIWDLGFGLVVGQTPVVKSQTS